MSKKAVMFWFTKRRNEHDYMRSMLQREGSCHRHKNKSPMEDKKTKNQNKKKPKTQPNQQTSKNYDDRNLRSPRTVLEKEVVM